MNQCCIRRTSSPGTMANPKPMSKVAVWTHEANVVWRAMRARSRRDEFGWSLEKETRSCKAWSAKQLTDDSRQVPGPSAIPLQRQEVQQHSPAARGRQTKLFGSAQGSRRIQVSPSGLEVRFNSGVPRKRIVEFAFWRMACFDHGHLPFVWLVCGPRAVYF
jgi:hypothetical protein